MRKLTPHEMIDQHTAIAEPGEYFCGDCDRVERDPIFLDLETCSQCGELLDWESDEPPNPYKHAATPFADNH